MFVFLHILCVVVTETEIEIFQQFHRRDIIRLQLMSLFQRSQSLCIHSVNSSLFSFQWFRASEHLVVQSIVRFITTFDQHQTDIVVSSKIIWSQSQSLFERFDWFVRLSQFVIYTTQTCIQLRVLRIILDSLIYQWNNLIRIFTGSCINSEQTLHQFWIHRIGFNTIHQHLFSLSIFTFTGIAKIQIVIGITTFSQTIFQCSWQIFLSVRIIFQDCINQTCIERTCSIGNCNYILLQQIICLSKFRCSYWQILLGEIIVGNLFIPVINISQALLNLFQSGSIILI